MDENDNGLKALSKAQSTGRKRSGSKGRSSAAGDAPAGLAGSGGRVPSDGFTAFDPGTGSGVSVGASSSQSRVKRSPDLIQPSKKGGRAGSKSGATSKPSAEDSVPSTKERAKQASSMVDAALRKKLAVSTDAQPLKSTDKRKLILHCRHLIDQFEGVARDFQKAGGGHREGPVYESWRDINHAQILLYRALALLTDEGNEST